MGRGAFTSPFAISDVQAGKLSKVRSHATTQSSTSASALGAVFQHQGICFVTSVTHPQQPHASMCTVHLGTGCQG